MPFLFEHDVILKQLAKKIRNYKRSSSKRCSKVNSAFHPSEVDKMSTRNFWELNGKK